MKCSTERLLSAYHDVELSAGRMREVERHLEDCPSCARRLAALAVTSRSFRSLAPNSGGDPMEARRTRRGLAPIAAAAGLVGLGVALYLAAPVRRAPWAAATAPATRGEAEPGAQTLECDWLSPDATCQLISPCLSPRDCGPDGGRGVAPIAGEPPHR